MLTDATSRAHLLERAREAAAEDAIARHRADIDDADRKARHLAGALAELLGWEPDPADIRTSAAGARVQISDDPGIAIGLRLAGRQELTGYAVCPACSRGVPIGTLQTLGQLGAWLEGNYRIVEHDAGPDLRCDGHHTYSPPPPWRARYYGDPIDVAEELAELDRQGYDLHRITSSVPHGWLITSRYVGGPDPTEPF